MFFHDLHDDVLAEILSSCDVYTALCIARVNKHFRAIALAKQLWISLLRDLEYRGMTDVAPGEDFATYTTHDLIEEVKRIVVGPKTWSPAWSAPTLLKRQSVVPFERESSTGTLDIRLLPGGRYFAVHQQASLKFFDVATGKSAWSYTHPHSIHSWSIDMSAGICTAVVVMVCPDTAQNINAVEVVEVNLKCGQADILARCPLPTNTSYLSLLLILGDLFAISLERTYQAPYDDAPGLVLLVNWRSNEYVLLVLNCSRPVRGHTGIVLVPNHLGMTHEESDTHTQMLLVYNIASFTPFWRPLSEISLRNGVSSRLLAPIAYERLAPDKIPISHCQFIDLTAYASPLRSDTYEFRLHTVDRIPRPQKRTFAGLIRRGLGRDLQDTPPDIRRSLLFSYRLNLSGSSSGLSPWRFLSSERIHGRIRARSLSFSRYCLHRMPQMIMITDALVKREDDEDGRPREIMLHSHVQTARYLSPYSSGVVSLTAHSLTVSYAL
ncbi:hypothetical protein DFH09DRAFT_1179012 [Mycena vulgaris]|nr:hypothetical protein DFH09DRAFT_1179012 [Mycena vulgaris]